MSQKNYIRLLYIVIILLILELAFPHIRHMIRRLLPMQDRSGEIIHTPYYRTKLSMFESMTLSKGSIVFLGDSLTDFADLDENLGIHALNRGIAGDTTKGVLNRLDEVTRHEPGKLFILVGTNDIFYGAVADDIAKNIYEIISRVHANSPATKIFVQSLFPTNNTKFQTNRPNYIIANINNMLRDSANELNYTYIDINSHLTKNGELDEKFTLDGLHINGRGVSVWMEILKPYLL